MSDNDFEKLHQQVAAILIQFNKLMTKVEERHEQEQAAVHRSDDKLKDVS